MTYKISCDSCRLEGRSANYYGETNRTLADRNAEHLAMLRRKQEVSILVEHWGQVHQNRKEAPTYKFNILGSHPSALERQLREAMNIAGSEDDFLLNRKSEFGRNCLITHSAEFDGKKWADMPEKNERKKEEGGEENPPPARKRGRVEEVRKEEVEAQISSPMEGTGSDRMFWGRILQQRKENHEEGKRMSTLKRKAERMDDSMNSQKNRLRAWLQDKPK